MLAFGLLAGPRRLWIDGGGSGQYLLGAMAPLSAPAS
jgi:hypothetical protein